MVQNGNLANQTTRQNHASMADIDSAAQGAFQLRKANRKTRTDSPCIKTTKILTDYNAMHLSTNQLHHHPAQCWVVTHDKSNTLLCGNCNFQSN